MAKKTSRRRSQVVVREKLRVLRKRSGLTQEALAERAGVSSDAVGRIESGSRVPTLDTLDKLSRALGVEVVDLFGTEALPLPRYQGSLNRIIFMLDGQPGDVVDAAQAMISSLVKVATGSGRRS